MQKNKVEEKTGFLSDSDLKKAIDNNEIVIWPFIEKNLTPLGYNLSFTKFIFSLKKKLFYRIEENDKEVYCVIEPHDTVLILTKEAVWISNKYAGTFHSKVGIVSKGFGHISTTLDPNWEGPLLISLNNPTDKKIKLVIGKQADDGFKAKTFITLIFYRMISEAKGKQDNLPSRIEILGEISKGLKDKEIKSAIENIQNFNSFQKNIGEARDNADRKKRIEDFKSKYEDFSTKIDICLNNVSKYSGSVVKFRKKVYFGILFLLVGILLIMLFNMYTNRKDTFGLQIISIITCSYVPIALQIESVMRKKLYN